MRVHRIGDTWLDAELACRGLEPGGRVDADGLVTVAPAVELRPMAELDADTWRETFARVAEKPFFAAREWLRRALERGSGSWVAVLPAVATRPFPGAGAAGAAAACFQTLVRVAAAEAGPSGVRANVVAAGWIAGAAPPELDPDLAVSDTPLGRLATPADVAGAVAWLLSGDAALVTGEVIRVDGGYTATAGARPDPTRR